MKKKLHNDYYFIFNIFWIVFQDQVSICKMNMGISGCSLASVVFILYIHTGSSPLTCSILEFDMNEWFVTSSTNEDMAKSKSNDIMDIQAYPVR